MSRFPQGGEPPSGDVNMGELLQNTFGGSADAANFDMDSAMAKIRSAASRLSCLGAVAQGGSFQSANSQASPSAIPACRTGGLPALGAGEVAPGASGSRT